MANRRTNIKHPYYVEGNTARKLHVVQEEQYPSDDIFVRQHKAKRRKRHNVHKGIVFFAILATLMVSIIYVKTEMAVRSYHNYVNGLEQDYQAIKEENDTLLENMNDNLDLNDVYQIATEELGMVLPQGDQIKYYDTNLGGSYMEQIAEIETDEESSDQLTSILGFVTKGW